MFRCSRWYWSVAAWYGFFCFVYLSLSLSAYQTLRYIFTTPSQPTENRFQLKVRIESENCAHNDCTRTSNPAPDGHQLRPTTSSLADRMDMVLERALSCYRAQNTVKFAVVRFRNETRKIKPLRGSGGGREGRAHLRLIRGHRQKGFCWVKELERYRGELSVGCPKTGKMHIQPRFVLHCKA